ncbi:SGNH/GDSL hydrolase family protein [Aquabacterium sp. A7-Y]|uniref:SGNH/GDSL hydrolase family protein n=1 Tax=Aquabacterium sp. A7-Y TaxID=1349605 RepID=UPI00223D54BD|nr:SGNH/GDSL hydrolase family protein [Aquabacterium sp. A7-Y]MCW7539091.1 SGNH/GDSL hydrolase family protein [Aquabacterium sp. A7-Y]
MSLRSSRWLFRLQLAALAGAAAALTACGGDVFDPFKPQRILSVGDEYSYIESAEGASKGAKYTINALKGDSTFNCDGHWLWTQFVTSNYGFRFKECTPDGAAPDERARALAREGAKAADISTQINAAGGLRAEDLVLVQVGANDVWELFDSYAQGNGLDGLKATAENRGRALAALMLGWNEQGVRVVVLDVTDQGDTPEAGASSVANAREALRQLSTAFNDGLRAGLAGNVRRTALIQANNLVGDAADDTRYDFDNRTDGACLDSVATAKACTTGTLKANTDPGPSSNDYIFAKGRYLTPTINRLLGDLAVNRAEDHPF